MPRGRSKSKQVNDAAVAENSSVVPDVPTVGLEDIKRDLENRLARLDVLRREMHSCGVDSIGKLDVLAGQLIAEIGKI